MAGCAAAGFAELVDSQINGGARQEAADATSDLQDFGADLGEGHVYLDDSALEFEPQSALCGLCKGVVRLHEDGSVDAPHCGTLGMCETEWAKKYPEAYRDVANGAMGGRIQCWTELGSCAILCIQNDPNGDLRFTTQGICEVDYRGTRWREEMRRSLKKEMKVYPEDGIPKFDGLDSGREE